MIKQAGLSIFCLLWLGAFCLFLWAAGALVIHGTEEMLHPKPSISRSCEPIPPIGDGSC